MKTEFESPDISDKRETNRIKLYLDVFALQCLEGSVAQYG